MMSEPVGWIRADSAEITVKRPTSMEMKMAVAVLIDSTVVSSLSVV